MVTVALNVTLAPAQTVVVPVLMLRVGALNEFTVIAIALDVTDVGEAQEAFEVITTLTKSLLPREDELNEALFVPAFIPFTFH